MARRARDDSGKPSAARVMGNERWSRGGVVALGVASNLALTFVPDVVPEMAGLAAPRRPGTFLRRGETSLPSIVRSGCRAFGYAARESLNCGGNSIVRFAVAHGMEPDSREFGDVEKRIIGRMSELAPIRLDSDGTDTQDWRCERDHIGNRSQQAAR